MKSPYKATFLFLLAWILFMSCPSWAADNNTLGIAYQTWNKPLGVWQTKEQLEYDLAEMARIGVRSLRVEFVWNLVEPTMDTFDFTWPDYLVEAARRHGMTLYPIIGFQWPPEWMGAEHRLAPLRKPSRPSPFMNYADPFVRQRFARFIKEVVTHFRGDRTIAAWVLGNEFGYVDFSTFEQLGYDKESTRQFGKNIDPSSYAILRDEDVISPQVIAFLDFRRHAVATVIGDACEAAKRADPGTRVTYSSIGVLFMPDDRTPLSEDVALIARECKRRGAPLDFLSINAYMNLNTEESFHLGLAHKLAGALSGLPVIFSEFGLTSTEQYADVDVFRQGPFLRAQYLQSIFDGVPEAHIFTWMDKRVVSDREKGFGLRTRSRKPKPAFSVIEETAAAIQHIDVPALQREIVAPAPQVGLLLPDPDVGFVQWNSWLNQNWIVASYLMRFDIPITFLRPDDLSDPQKVGAIRVLILCRQGLLGQRYLARVADLAKQGRFNVLSISDIPGMDRRNEDISKWESLVQDLFGVHYVGPIGHAGAPIMASLRLPKMASVAVLPRMHEVTPLPGLGIASNRAQAMLRILDARGGRVPATMASLVFSRHFNRSTAVMIPFTFDHQQISAEHMSEFRASHEAQQSASDVRFLEFTDDWLAELLRDVIISELGLGTTILMHTTQPAVNRALPLTQTRRLKNGGHLLLFQAIPPLRSTKTDQRPNKCPDWTQRFEVTDLDPSERFVSLMTQEVFVADQNGLLSLVYSACDSDLLITEKAFKRLSITPQPMQKALSDSVRRRIFPAMAFLDNRVKETCIRDAFEHAGFQATRPPEAWQESIDRWLVEEARSDGPAWREPFGTLVLPSWRTLSQDDVQTTLAFLNEDHDRRVITSAIGLVERLSTIFVWLRAPGQVLITDSECSNLAPIELERFLFEGP